MQHGYFYHKQGWLLSVVVKLFEMKANQTIFLEETSKYTQKKTVLKVPQKKTIDKKALQIFFY